MWEGPDIGRVCYALEDASVAFGVMLRRIPDGSMHAIGAWSIAETASHVARCPAYFLAALRGELEHPEELDKIPEANAAALAADAERDLRVLADRHDAGEAELIAYARSLENDALCEPFADVKVPFSSALCVELGEVLVHGYDVARASRSRWTIEPHAAAMTVEGLVPLLPSVVDPVRSLGKQLRCELTVRHGPTVELELRGGVMSVDGPVERPLDCRISADPVAFLLLVYGRIALWRALVTGRMTAWGRRPWRAVSLKTALMKL
jgi:uncharacterized protein (TIGR03083 family)